MKITAEHKVVTWNNNSTVPITLIPSSWFQVLLVTVWHCHYILVNMAHVWSSFDQRMSSLYPVGWRYRLKATWRPTPVLPRSRCWSCVNDDRHEPGSWDFAKKNDKNCAQLPFANVSNTTRYHITGVGHFSTQRKYKETRLKTDICNSF